MNAVQSDLFHIGSEKPWQDLGSGVQRQLLGFNDQLMVVKVKFETGAIGSQHEHPQSQSSFVNSGVFELTIGDEKKILKAGDGYYVPPNTVHGAVCLQAGVIIDSFNPYREDFLQFKL